ncbi:hypothetical protein ACWF94_00590 [Streptomyces sp. NPDC055078]
MNHETISNPPLPLWERDLPPAPVTVAGAADIADLARDAAQRARALLDGQPFDNDPIVDLVRLLHGRSTADAEAAAGRAGMRLAELRRLRAAFTFGGTTAVRVALHPSSPDEAALDEAVRAIESKRATATGPLEVTDNRITDPTTGVQIRLGPDDLWYPFTANGDDWAPAPRPASSPADAYTAARTAVRNRGTVNLRAQRSPGRTPAPNPAS